jgi:hypothetical protein
MPEQSKPKYDFGDTWVALFQLHGDRPEYHDILYLEHYATGVYIDLV